MHRPGAAGIPILGMYVSPFPLCIFVTLWQVLQLSPRCRASALLLDGGGRGELHPRGLVQQLVGRCGGCSILYLKLRSSSSLNVLFSGLPWDARGTGVQELVNATALALQTYSLLRAEGHDAPRAIIMIGLQNGPPADPKALGDESQWIYDNFVVPLGRDAFVSLPSDSLPLLVVLACGMGETPNSSVTQTIGRGLFTVRYMSTQLQENPDLGLKKGFWSWMDGITPR